MKRWRILFSTLMLGVGMLAGCKSSSTSLVEETTSSVEETVPESSEPMTESEFDDSQPALTVGYSGTLDSLNPLFADTYASRMITEITQVKLLTTDRSGNVVYDAAKGESIVYKGIEYDYSGAANIDVKWDKEREQTTYTITLRSDLKFSDGTSVDADDLIFTLYLLSDPAYDGPYTVYSMPIVGMKSYRSNAPADESVTQEEITQALEEMPTALYQILVNDIIRNQLEQELDWCKTIFADGEYSLLTKQYNSYLEMFAFFYGREGMSIEEELLKEENAEQLLNTIVAQYGANYKELGKTCCNDETVYEKQAQQLTETWLIEEKKAQGIIGNAPNISGIKKINARKIVITTDGYDANAIYQLDIPIVPLHYYGNEDLYDYENNQFGFIKEDLSSVYQLNTTSLGAGPYELKSCENGTILMTANSFYYKGVPKTEQLQFVEVSEEDKISAVANGMVDIARIGSSLEDVEEIRNWNSNGALTGDTLRTDMVDNLSYGYIGMQAEQVNVLGNADSEKSKSLRKGLATVFAYYRQSAVEAYFGTTAKVIDYPLSQALWASPQKSDNNYEIAFSTDVHENPIYLENMTEEEKLQAMKNAVLDYFQEAGYVVSDGRVISAPEGASLEYEILLVQIEGSTNPCQGLIQQAAETLEELGITLRITYLQSQAEMIAKLKEGVQQLWVEESPAMIYPDLYEQYYSTNCPGMGGTNENYFRIQDKDLDFLILEEQKHADKSERKILYKQSLDLLMDWAVEIPIYQGTDNVLFSTKRVDVTTVVENITSYYSWLKEIEKISLTEERYEEENEPTSQEQ